ncbi:hypothetical protein GF314_02945 [bacterium]|nr:hypothetical protein [bacterium]
MKKMLALAFVALMASAVAAQPGMGIFFSNESFTDADTNFDTAGAAFDAYLVLLGAEFASVGGYECGVDISDAGVFILDVSGPNGWTNFGDNTNHLCGYQTPLMVDPDQTIVLATFNMLYAGTAEVTIALGQSTPPSLPDWDGPVVADAAFPDDLIGTYCTGGETPGVVATLNGDGVTATEARSLSDIKALF